MLHVVRSGVLILSAAIAASAQSHTGIVEGDYSGRYRCDNVWHPARLHIMDDGGGNMRADFTFLDRSPIESFRLWGKYSATGVVRLRPVAAQRAWPQFTMSGTFDAAAHKFAGRITSGTCTEFEFEPWAARSNNTPGGQPGLPGAAPPAPKQPPANPREALTTLPACDLVTHQEMEAVLGLKLREPRGATYTGEQAKQFKNTRRLSSCQFQEAGTQSPKTIFLSVTSHIAANPNEVMELHRNIEINWRAGQLDIPGVGDAAVWSAQSGAWDKNPSLRVGRFFVFVGGLTQMQIDVDNIPEESAALEIAKKLAVRLLGAPEGPRFTYDTKPARPALVKPVLPKLPANPTAAEKLLRDITAKAEAGIGQAQLRLGMLYEYATLAADGKIKPDYPAAAYWYQEAARKGVPDGAYCLALLYQDGKGVPKDESAAVEFFTQAGGAGYVPAMRGLAALYLRRGTWGGVGRASEWLRKAADTGDAGAMVLIGYQFQKGIGTIRNDYLALQSYQKAAALGDCTAMMNIGGIYFNGSSVSHIPQDAAQAKTWFAKAETCDAADSGGVRKQAAEFRAKAARHELPVFSDPHVQAGPSGLVLRWPDDHALVSSQAINSALGFLFALANSIPDGPRNSGDPMDLVLKQDRDLKGIMQRRDQANEQWFRDNSGMVRPH